MKYDVTTSAQVARTYAVVVDEGLEPADAEQQARKRLRSFIADPGMVGPGIVEVQADRQTNTSAEKITASEPQEVADEPKIVDEPKVEKPSEPVPSRPRRTAAEKAAATPAGAGGI